MSPTTEFNVYFLCTTQKKACKRNRTIIQRCPRRSKGKRNLLMDRSVINDDGSEVRTISELPQIYAQNHSDPTSDCTSITALWSLVLDWRRQAVYECLFFFSNRKRERGEVIEFELRLGRATEWDVFASRARVTGFTLRLTWAAQAALTETCKQVAGRSREREGRRSIRCDVLGPTVRITMTGAKAPLPSLLNRTAPCSSIYF